MIQNNLKLLRQNPWLKKFYARLVKIGFFRKSPWSVTIFTDSYLGGLIAASAAIGEAKAPMDEALEPIHMAFSKQNIRSVLLGNDWWLDFLISASNLDDKSLVEQHQLIDKTNTIDSELLAPWELQQIYFLALRVGLFSVGYGLRCKSRESAIHSLSKGGKIEPYQAVKAISALMELGQYDQSLGAVNSFQRINPYGKELLLYLHSILLPTEIASSVKAENSYISEQDTKFKDFVRDKTIAIVGPVKTSSRDAEIIESYDLVVRCNYYDSSLGVDNLVKGSRCDITYLTNILVNYIQKSSAVSWPQDIRWVVCKSLDQSLYKQVMATKKMAQPQLRSIKDVQFALFSGSLNAIPNIVLDLLRFKPAKLHIFHADLMLTSARAANYLPHDLAVQLKVNSHVDRIHESIQSFLGHDPITQYSILSNLWHQGKVTGDNRFNQVMALGEREYMAQLQLIYGSYPRLTY